MSNCKKEDCWKCHWCWLGRCMHSSHYGEDVSVVTEQPECSYYISKAEWNETYVAPMKQERCMELLNAMINNLSVAEKNSEVIKQLLHIGFTSEELIKHFSFTNDDVEDIVKEMEAEE